MRIAYVVNSMEGGGAALPIPDLVAVLKKGGAAVRVFALTRRDGRAIAAIEQAGIEVTVRTGGETDHLAALRWLGGEVRRWRATHLWTSLTRATLLGQQIGLRHGIPVVSWQHNAFLKPANLALLRLSRGLTRLWVGDSEPITRLTAERLRMPAHRVATWPIFRADPRAPRATPWRPGETIRIGSLGRLHAAKGYDVLVDAVSRLPASLPPFSIDIAGEGAERAALEARVARAGVAGLRFPGYAPDPREWLTRLHLYVQPSRREGLCVAAHEAMLAGLPVIASRVGALPGSVTGRTGVLVSPEDPVALAEALATLIRGPDQLATMGEAARARMLDMFGVERFEAAGLALIERMRGL